MINIFEWNINQATNYTGDNNIPQIVTKEIEKQGRDIIVFTEISASCKNMKDFFHEISNLGYDYRITDNKQVKQNDVLVAWKREKYTVVDSGLSHKAIGDTPEVLMVEFIDNESNESFLVVGTRIKLCGNGENAWDLRRAQMNYLLTKVNEHYPKLKNVIIAGDFNNNRTDLENCAGKSFVDKWSIKVIDDIANKHGFKRCTPYSHGSIKGENSFFKEDHFLVKGFKESSVEYSRTFTCDNKDIYLHGNDFEIYNFRVKRVIWSIPYGSGIPDHAILTGNFILEKCEK